MCNNFNAIDRNNGRKICLLILNYLLNDHLIY